VIRQSHLIAVVGAFLIAVVVVGCAGVRSEAPQKDEQGHAEATASEEARCSQTRTFRIKGLGVHTTNDVPGCPKGGLLSGTDKTDNLDGKDGDDEIRGLGATDFIEGGLGSDIIYGGPGGDFLVGSKACCADRSKDVLYGGDGDDEFISGGKGEDVLYGGKGNDGLEGDDAPTGRGPLMRDELYCGLGKDSYAADRLDYVDSSCEEKVKGFGGGIA
jgi:Ca2+-binding RTX toxin-like protein